MVTADIVAPILSTLEYLCVFVLAFYTMRVVVFVIRGRNPKDDHRMREAMAMAYTVVAAWFIFFAIGAIHPFVQNIIEAVGVVAAPSIQIRILLAISSAFVCSAFLCNFSRSLWMLKSLDQGLFDPVPEWETLTGTKLKRFFEFATRTVAALLFIVLEFQLERFAASRKNSDVAIQLGADSPDRYLTQAGFLGLLLYCSLILWWLVGRWIAKDKMPWTQLSFYGAGLINSMFIASYAGKVATTDQAVMLLMFIVVVTLAATYMLGLVVVEILKETWAFVAIFRNHLSSTLLAQR